MKIFGVAGWSGSGKTTLLKRLIPELVARGVTVSTVKHAHHEFDVDVPGKDSYEHRAAGATEVMVSSARRWAVVHELRGDEELTLPEILKRLGPVDLVLIEGFKREGHDKLEVYRAGVGKPPLYPDDPHIVAVASDAPVPGLRLPRLDLDDVAGIADFVLEHCGIARARTRVV
jgi:molybdopterin-guanine dinucleotide biosynthesis protein B